MLVPTELWSDEEITKVGILTDVLAQSGKVDKFDIWIENKVDTNNKSYWVIMVSAFKKLGGVPYVVTEMVNPEWEMETFKPLAEEVLQSIVVAFERREELVDATQ